MHAAYRIDSGLGEDVLCVVPQRHEESCSCVRAPLEDFIDLLQQIASLAGIRRSRVVSVAVIRK